MSDAKYRSTPADGFVPKRESLRRLGARTDDFEVVDRPADYLGYAQRVSLRPFPRSAGPFLADPLYFFVCSRHGCDFCCRLYLGVVHAPGKGRRARSIPDRIFRSVPLFLAADDGRLGDLHNFGDHLLP